jgi:hypothetical protein
MSIKVRSIEGRVSESTNNDKNELFHVTGQPLGVNRRALDVIHHGYYEVAAGQVAEAGSTDSRLTLTGHSIKKGDMIKLLVTAGSIDEQYVAVEKVIDANNVLLAAVLSAALQAGDTFDILRPTIIKTDSAGGALAGAIAFTRDGASQTVTEDTGTPANNRPLPVKIIGLNGNLEVTAQNLNIQSTHTGANPDSMQIGDGTRTVEMTASNEMKVNDASAIALLTTIDADTSALFGCVDGTDLKVKITDAGAAASESTLADIKTAVEIIDNAINGNEMQVDIVDAGGIALEATQLAMSAKLPASLGQKADADSLSVTLSTEQEAIQNAIKTAVEIIDNAISGNEMQVDIVDPGTLATEATLSNIETALADVATETTLDAIHDKFPASLGAKTSAASLSVVQASDAKPLTLDVVHYASINFAVSNVTQAAYTELTADTGGTAGKRVQIFMSAGDAMYLAIGALASEVKKFIINPGGFPDGGLEVDIPANSRLSLQRVNAGTTNSGELFMNIMG